MRKIFAKQGCEIAALSAEKIFIHTYNKFRALSLSLFHVNISFSASTCQYVGKTLNTLLVGEISQRPNTFCLHAISPRDEYSLVHKRSRRESERKPNMAKSDMMSLQGGSEVRNQRMDDGEAKFATIKGKKGTVVIRK